MTLDDRDLEFLDANHAAGMITVTPDGVAKAVRVAVAMMDGKLLSSGTRDRARTRRLREDPRCTLYVHDQGFGYLTLETRVTILEGPEVPAQHVRLFRKLQGKPTGPLGWFGAELEEDEFVQRMVEEGRVLYEFEVVRAYGLH